MSEKAVMCLRSEDFSTRLHEMSKNAKSEYEEVGHDPATLSESAPLRSDRLMRS